MNDEGASSAAKGPRRPSVGRVQMAGKEGGIRSRKVPPTGGIPFLPTYTLKGGCHDDYGHPSTNPFLNCRDPNPNYAEIIELHCCDLFDYYRCFGIDPLSPQGKIHILR